MGRVSGWRVVWSAVAGAALSPVAMNAAHAEGFMDALDKATEAIKKADEKLQQAQIQQKPGTGQDTKTADVRTASAATSNTAAASGGKAASQPPDVAGIKLGMSRAQVSDIIKAKKLGYEEMKLKMQYFDTSRGTTAEVPGGSFLNIVRARSTVMVPAGGDKKFQDFIEVDFTPEPGKERVVRVMRRVVLDREHYLLKSELMKALTDKYGTPTANPMSPPQQSEVFWRLGSLPVIKDRNEMIAQRCVNDGSGMLALFDSLSQQDIAITRSFVLDLNGNVNESKPDPYRPVIDRCGDAFAFTDLNVVNTGEPPDRQLVSEYMTSLADFKMRFDTYKSASALMAAAQQSQSKQQSDRAKGQRPDL